MCVSPSRMGTFVTLAEVLEARGSPLDEDEVWCLLLAATEALLDISQKGNTLPVPISPPVPPDIWVQGSFLRQAFKSIQTDSF